VVDVRGGVEEKQIFRARKFNSSKETYFMIARLDNTQVVAHEVKLRCFAVLDA